MVHGTKPRASLTHAEQMPLPLGNTASPEVHFNSIAGTAFPTQIPFVSLFFYPAQPTLFFPPHGSGRTMVLKCKPKSSAMSQASPRMTSITKPQTKQTETEIYLKTSFLPLLIHSLLLTGGGASLPAPGATPQHRNTQLLLTHFLAVWDTQPSQPSPLSEQNPEGLQLKL